MTTMASGPFWGKMPCATVWLWVLTRNPRFCRNTTGTELRCLGQPWLLWKYIRLSLWIRDSMMVSYSTALSGYYLGTIWASTVLVSATDPDAHTRKEGGKRRLVNDGHIYPNLLSRSQNLTTPSATSSPKYSLTVACPS